MLLLGGGSLCLLYGSPQEIAIISVKQNVRWSYAKVDADSNRLARWMQNRGIGPGSNVGMFLPRSAEVCDGGNGEGVRSRRVVSNGWVSCVRHCISLGSHVHVNYTQVYVTLISILKSGAAYVPIDPAYPADRVSYIMGDARCPVMLTSMALPIFHDIFVQHNQYVCACMLCVVCVCVFCLTGVCCVALWRAATCPT
jgi:non-ribosomal peptide synthetase component F